MIKNDAATMLSAFNRLAENTKNATRSVTIINLLLLILNLSKCLALMAVTKKLRLPQRTVIKATKLA